MFACASVICVCTCLLTLCHGPSRYVQIWLPALNKKCHVKLNSEFSPNDPQFWTGESSSKASSSLYRKLSAAVIHSIVYPIVVRRFRRLLYITSFIEKNKHTNVKALVRSLTSSTSAHQPKTLWNTILSAWNCRTPSYSCELLVWRSDLAIMWLSVSASLSGVDENIENEILTSKHH